MKKYRVEIGIKFETNPANEDFDVIRDKLIDEIDNLPAIYERSFMTTYPAHEDIEKKNYYYRVNVFFKHECQIRSADLFRVLNEIQPLRYVMIKETRFDKRDSGIFWFNEGETTYYDGGTYVCPYYDFFVNGHSYYTLEYVPGKIKNYDEKDKKKYDGVMYMWTSTGSWDNFLKAQTLDEAIKEFEEFYHKICWESVERNRERLTEAENLYKQMSKYRWNKINKEIR